MLDTSRCHPVYFCERPRERGRMHANDSRPDLRTVSKLDFFTFDRWSRSRGIFLVCSLVRYREEIVLYTAYTRQTVYGTVGYRVWKWVKILNKNTISHLRSRSSSPCHFSNTRDKSSIPVRTSHLDNRRDTFTNARINNYVACFQVNCNSVFRVFVRWKNYFIGKLFKTSLRVQVTVWC